MARIVVVLGALIALHCASLAGTPEDDAYGAFEFFCIENIGKLSKFGELLPAVGFSALSPSQAKPFLGSHQGEAWMAKTKNTRLVLMTEDNTACVLIAPDADPSITEGLLERNAVARELHSEQNGSEIERMFAVTQRDPDGGSNIKVVVTENYSTLKTRGALT